MSTMRSWATALLAIGLATTSASARTIIDSADRKVEVPDTVRRVVAAGPPAEAALYTLAPDKLIGLVRPFTSGQRAYVPDKYATLPVTGSFNGHGADDSDAVKALKPDIIVDIGDVTPRYAAIADQTQKRLGIPYLLFDGTLARTADTYRALGAALNEPERAEALARAATAMLGDVQRALTGLSADRQERVYYGRGKNGLTTGMAGSINVEVIDAAGGINVGDALGRGGLKTIPEEQLLSWNPDVIVAQEKPFYDSLLSDSKWRGLNAVARKHVFLAPNAPFGWIEEPPSVNRLIGVRWLAALLYPERFADDIRPIVRSFYRQFYKVDLDESEVDRLLSPAATKDISP